ncbi:MAG: IS110 family transposase [Methanophagales archaeon]|nr:IS110 family transposase [Methanophagales archaeon]
MYIGSDVHKKNSNYTMVDGQGREVEKGRFPTTCEGLDEFASKLPEDAKVAIEASTSGIFVYEYLDERGIEVHLAHPVYVKPFAKRHVKTDKVDAGVLAQLLRMDYLPESYVPGKEIRDQRVMIRHHASLVRLRTSVKNRVHALLAIEGIQTSEFSDLFGKKGMEFLRGVKLRSVRRKALDNYLEVLKVLEERIDEIEDIMKEKTKITDEAKWLMSIPGIGYHNALLMQSELGEIERFSNPRSVVNYSGLAPKVEQSGDYTRYGHINKHSNGFLRWAFIQSARAAVHSSKPNRFQRIYKKIKARRGEKVAIVAVARHMAESVY